MQEKDKCRKCKDKSSCNYFVGRFKVEHCDPDRQKKVDEAHAIELEEREGRDTFIDRKDAHALSKTYKDIIKEQHSR